MKALTVKTTHQMKLAKQRQDFIDAGGYDGRFKQRSIPSGKAYKRNSKHKNKPLE